MTKVKSAAPGLEIHRRRRHRQRMKWFFLLLLLGGAGYAFYVFQDEIFEAVGMGKDKGSEEQAGDGTKGGGTKGGKPEPEVKPEPPKPRPEPPKPTNNDPIAKKYPMPDFKPIEELVGGWQELPSTSSAFPREIVLKQKAKYVIAGGAGSSTAPAGSKSTALGLTAGQLVISPRPGSNVRGRIPVEHTNFKEVLGAAYETYKDRKRKQVMAQRDRARALAAAETGSQPDNNPGGGAPVIVTVDPKPSSSLLLEYEAKIGKMPDRAPDGRVPLMVQSIQRGDVNEIKLNEIEGWGPIRYELVEGKPYWTGTVIYQTASLFGTFDTEAMALMRDGRVVNWVYSGSLEEVP